MTGRDDAATTANRRIVVRTTHDDPNAVAAAIEPDNTDEIDTRVEGGSVHGGTADGSTAEGGAVETRIDRPTTGGLQATADDYVVNLHVAVQCTTDNPNDNTS